MRTRSLLVAAAALGLLLPAASTAAPTGESAALALARSTAERLGTTLTAPDAPPVSSTGVDLATTVPGSFAGGRITGKNLVATGWDGFATFDISNPAQPVPLAVLPLAHFENEDVETDGRIALVSNDRERENKGGFVYVVDVTSMAMPKLASVFHMTELESTERGPGHTANCVAPGKRACDLVWFAGGKRIWVADFSNAASPRMLGAFSTPASTGSAAFGEQGKPETGSTHDVERAADGTLWVTGSGGAFGYKLTSDPLAPKLLGGTGKAGIDPKVNDFILHNARAGKDVLYVTEEDYVDTDEAQPGSCHGQGKFQTWDSKNAHKGRDLRLLDQWQTEIAETSQLDGNKAPLTATCSSHWFQVRNGLAAVSWYEQGVRILDVTKPKSIAQKGWWLPANSISWQSLWASDDLVYSFDVTRGIDVLRVDRKALAAQAGDRKAPIRAEWLGVGGGARKLAADEVFGWMCSTLTPAGRLEASAHH